MTSPRRATPALALLFAALCCPGCTAVMWGDAVQARAGGPRAVGLVPAASPADRDRLFLRYTDHPDRGKRYYAVAQLDGPADGPSPQSDSGAGNFHRLTHEAFRQWESDPGWVYVRGKCAGQHGGGPDGRAPGGLAALELQPAYRRRTPPAPGSPPATTQHWDAVEAALAPWKGRVIWVPSTVPRPQSERTADVCSAVLLTPATLAADVVWVPIMIPVLLLYSAGGHTC
jgi:hypothetical protein